jgi:hypothetical protein
MSRLSLPFELVLSAALFYEGRAAVEEEEVKWYFCFWPP